MNVWPLYIGRPAAADVLHGRKEAKGFDVYDVHVAVVVLETPARN